MPELPEVEAARRAVQEHCTGGLICRAVVAEDTKVIEGMAPFDMQRALVGKRILGAHRKGKQLWLELDEPPSPSFQFGMSGAVYIKGVKLSKYVRSAVNDEDEWPSKYSKVFLELDNGVEMSFTDKRRFARVRLLDNPATSAPISELGPDAFMELPEDKDFADAVMNKKISIKALLLDQSFLSGIGNWIADEVLYQSRIHPEKPASTLSIQDCERLHQSIKEVLQTAIDAEADSSKYPEDWIFHHREKKAGDTFVNGKKIDFITVGGRTSAYVPELQKYDAGGNGPKKRSSSRKKATEERDEGKDEHADGKGKKKANVVEEPEVGKKKRVQKKPAVVAVEAEKQDAEKPKRRGRPPKSATTSAQQATDDLPKESAEKAANVESTTTEEEDDLSYSLCAEAPCMRRFTLAGAGSFSRFYESKGPECVFGVRSSSSLFLNNPNPSKPFNGLQLLGRALIPPKENGRFGMRLLSYVLRKSSCFV